MHLSPLITRRWMPPRSMLVRGNARAALCSSGSPPFCFRKQRLPVSLSKASLILAENRFSPWKIIFSSGTHRHYSTPCASPIFVCTSNMDEGSVISISPCGNASGKVSRVSSAMARRYQRVPNTCLFFRVPHRIETASSKLTLPRDSDCVLAIGQRLPHRQGIPVFTKRASGSRR